MEDINSLKTELVNKDALTLRQLLLSKVEIVDEIKRSQDQQFNENGTKIKELMSKLAAMKETLNTETQTLEQNNVEFSKEKDCLEELEAEKKKLLQEIKQLEGKHNDLKAAKPNVQDQQLLEQGRKKLNLYKDWIKIQWDYEASKHSIKGYVSNKCDYIHHFCYENREINDELIDSLWHEIYLSVSKDKIRDENLLNNPANVTIVSK